MAPTGKLAYAIYCNIYKQSIVQPLTQTEDDLVYEGIPLSRLVYVLRIKKNGGYTSEGDVFFDKDELERELSRGRYARIWRRGSGDYQLMAMDSADPDSVYDALRHKAEVDQIWWSNTKHELLTRATTNNPKGLLESIFNKLFANV